MCSEIELNKLYRSRLDAESVKYIGFFSFVPMFNHVENMELVDKNECFYDPTLCDCGWVGQTRMSCLSVCLFAYLSVRLWQNI